VTFDAKGATAEMEPLNRRLTNEVLGAGAWDAIQRT